MYLLGKRFLLHYTSGGLDGVPLTVEGGGSGESPC